MPEKSQNTRFLLPDCFGKPLGMREAPGLSAPSPQ